MHLLSDKPPASHRCATSRTTPPLINPRPDTLPVKDVALVALQMHDLSFQLVMVRDEAKETNFTRLNIF